MASTDPRIPPHMYTPTMIPEMVIESKDEAAELCRKVLSGDWPEWLCVLAVQKLDAWYYQGLRLNLS